MCEFFPSFALGWEGKDGTEIACGYGVHVFSFNGAVVLLSLILSLLHLKDVLRHAGSFVPPRWHGEADIDGVCVVKTATVVGKVVEELFCGYLVVVSIRVFELDDPHIFHDGEDES